MLSRYVVVKCDSLSSPFLPVHLASFFEYKCPHTKVHIQHTLSFSLFNSLSLSLSLSLFECLVSYDELQVLKLNCGQPERKNCQRMTQRQVIVLFNITTINATGYCCSFFSLSLSHFLCFYFLPSFLAFEGWKYFRPARL